MEEYREIPAISIEANLFSWMNETIKELFNSENFRSGKRDLEILAYRKGLYGHETLTLEEIGIIFDNLSGERVRQLENRAFTNLSELLNTGKNESMKLILRQEDFSKLDDFKSNLIKLNSIINEEEIEKQVTDYFSLINVDIYFLRLLLEIFGFNPIVLESASSETYYLWVKEEINTKKVIRIINEIVSFLKKIVAPQSLHDIILQINKRKKKSSRFSTDEIQQAIEVCRDIEQLPDKTFQVNYSCLRTYEDKLFRILFNENRSMHIQQLAIILNLNATKYGERSGITPHHIGSRLSSDERFQPIGRSGEWKLASWDHISTDYVLDLMEEALHSSGIPLSLEDIFNYVKSKRPVEINAIAAYLSQDNSFSRVGTNLFGLSTWGMKSETTLREKNSEPISKAKLCELLEEVFSDHQTDTMFVSDLSREITDQTDRSEQAIYYRILESPAVKVFDKYLGNKKRKMATFISGYRSKLTKLEILTKEIPVRELIQKTVKEILISSKDQSLELQKTRDLVVQKISCPKASVYSAVDLMEAIKKSKNEKGQVVLTLLTHKKNFKEAYKSLSDQKLIIEIDRALDLIKIDSVDLGLFQLGKIFEATVKEYMKEIQRSKQYPITSNDLNNLFSMIKWVERNGIITDRRALDILRIERNSRAHGAPPDLDEREALMENAETLVNYYLDYIVLFEKRREKLI